MRIVAAYFGVILLWSTTPLAIKWSAEGAGFLFGVTSRMFIGAICVALVLLVRRQRLVWHRRALLTYLSVTAQIYGSMLMVYWSSQFIPSGWISVVYGLTPPMTAMLAAACLGERGLTPLKLCAYALGAGGLYVMFGSALRFGKHAALGLGAALIATFLHSASSVFIKRLKADIPPMTQVGGGLLFSLPAYLLTWGIFDGHWPALLPTLSWAAIVYLGVIATSIGFAMYYFVLQVLPATRVALINLITPVLALILGYTVNHEPLTPQIAAGTGLILAALLLHEFPQRQVIKADKF